MQPRNRETISWAIGRHWIDLFVSANDGIFSLNFPAATTEITDKFVECFELLLRRFITVEITDQTDAERNVIQVIAVDVAAVDLFDPSGAEFDLAVAGRTAIADDEMVGHPVWHFPRVPMIVIEDFGVALTGAAVVDDNVFPAAFFDRSSIDSPSHAAGYVAILR